MSSNWQQSILYLVPDFPFSWSKLHAVLFQCQLFMKWLMLQIFAYFYMFQQLTFLIICSNLFIKYLWVIRDLQFFRHCHFHVSLIIMSSVFPFQFQIADIVNPSKPSLSCTNNWVHIRLALQVNILYCYLKTKHFGTFWTILNSFGVRNFLALGENGVSCNSCPCRIKNMAYAKVLFILFDNLRLHFKGNYKENTSCPHMEEL